MILDSAIELTEKADELIFGDARIPHEVSNPVLRKVDNQICACFFVCVFDFEMLQSGIYERPIAWIALDALDGNLVGSFSCNENDFSSTSFSKSYSMEDSSAVMPDEDYYRQMDDYFNKAQRSIQSQEGFDLESYTEYMRMLLAITPKDFRIFYEELSDLIPD